MYYCFLVFVVFFFKQKTAYEMRFSDSSSDVCSSDLEDSCFLLCGGLGGGLGGRRDRGRQRLTDRQPHGGDLLLLGDDDFLGQPFELFVMAVAQQQFRHVDGALVMRARKSVV